MIVTLNWNSPEYHLMQKTSSGWLNFILVLISHLSEITLQNGSGVSLSVLPPVNNSVFSLSSLITWPTNLKLCRVILDIGTQSRSVPDFAIFPQGALWGHAF